ncbi:S1C family serine protease [Haloimpatiens sp. FM7315]|uniref:S1C family serine protease n=1 Tax=Haloimpatiens sp. FM7315 TaxID=3298609 RepID=UPI00370A17B3
MGGYDDNNDIKKNEEQNNYQIKFRNNKKNAFLKSISYFVIIVLVAVLSSVVTANYITEKKFPELQKSLKKQNTSTSSSKGIETVTSEPIKENAVTKVAETVGPAVVAISNSQEGFFGDVENGSGSGIIFNEEGYIVTNYHVIEGATKVTVKLSSGKELNAKIIGTDSKSDLAVIKIDAKNLPVAKFGDSSKVKVGDMAIAIGNPLGEEFAGSVTAGIISALNRKIVQGEAVYKVLQTDAAINPGNSGGALCNSNGEVIGINSLKLGASVNAEGMGFSIAINEAKDIVDQLMKNGKVIRPVVGIYGGTVNPQASGGVKGVYVSKIVTGSGAEKAGVLQGDVITEFSDKKVETMSDLSSILFEHKVGDEVSCKVYRDGKTKKLKIKLTQMQ